MSMKGYEDIIRTLPEMKVQPDSHAAMFRVICDWIRDDLGAAAKMAIMPEHVDKLIVRLTEE